MKTPASVSPYAGQWGQNFPNNFDLDRRDLDLRLDRHDDPERVCQGPEI